VLKWFIAVFLALVVCSAALPWLERLGLGRMPGDFRFRLFGRQWLVPLTSTVVLSLLVMAITKML
jgi:hypothetical protein